PGRRAGVVDGDAGALGATQRQDARGITAGVQPAADHRGISAKDIARVGDVDRTVRGGVDGDGGIVAAHRDRAGVVHAGAGVAAAGIDTEALADPVGARVDVAFVAHGDRVAALGLDACGPVVAVRGNAALRAILHFDVRARGEDAVRQAGVGIRQDAPVVVHGDGAAVGIRVHADGVVEPEGLDRTCVVDVDVAAAVGVDAVGVKGADVG